MKILVVDDDPKLRTLLSRFLTAKGFEIVEAANGAEGVEMAQNAQPGLIVMDINMPTMDGFAATRAIKAQAQTAQIPVLVLTAEDAQANYDDIYAAGADGYVSKPVDFEQFLGRVQEYT